LLYLVAGLILLSMFEQSTLVNNANADKLRPGNLESFAMCCSDAEDEQGEEEEVGRHRNDTRTRQAEVCMFIDSTVVS
jgi:hypothetical protein